MMKQLKDESYVVEIGNRLFMGKPIVKSDLFRVGYLDLFILKPDCEKELWFVTKNEDLEKALEDSKARDIYYCAYYPKMEGNFLYQVLDHSGSLVNSCAKLVDGVLDLADKMILLLNPLVNDEIDEYHVYQSIGKTGFNTQVSYTKKLSCDFTLRK